VAWFFKVSSRITEFAGRDLERPQKFFFKRTIRVHVSKICSIQGADFKFHDDYQGYGFDFKTTFNHL
jgi:hypothetical protein